MTDYTYRWVCVARHDGTPDTGNAERYVRRGWEPVPPDERPLDIEPMRRADGTEDTGLALYRMPADIYTEQQIAKTRNDLFLARPETQIALANKNIEAHKAQLEAETGRKVKGWGPITGGGITVEGVRPAFVPKLRNWQV